VKLFPRILIASTLISSLSFAGMVNGIAVIINKEPITLYEVYKYSEHFKIAKKEALDILVRQKLEDAEIKRQGIDADIFEVDSYIQNLAKQNGMSEFDFLKMLQAQKVDIDVYKKDLKTKLKRDKLYQRIIQEKVGRIDESEIKEFYEANKNQFSFANEYTLKEFKAQNENLLQSILQNPMLRPEGVSIEDKVLSHANLSHTNQALLSQTPEGKYSSITQENGVYMMYYVIKKEGISYIPFENVRNNIYGYLYKQKEQKAIEDHFEKLKSSANIQVLRNPN
jgi:hypothetical protein